MNNLAEDNYKHIYSWTIILEKIVANITPDIAKECADFCFAAIQFNIRNMQSDREKTLASKFAKILEYVKQIKSGNVQNNYTELYYKNPKRNSTEPPPPNTIPNHQLDGFTMNGQIPVLYWYFDERKNLFDAPVINSAEQYKEAFKNLENKSFKYYGEAINLFYSAFEKYKLRGKSVLIWGLAGLNCEAMAIWQGAEHVYVVDYNKPVCEHEKITVFNHEELLRSGIKTDVAISFSSFEHDGLGRYGDPLNPNGDIEAMSAVRNFLRDDGFMFLGVPQGQDCLVWNAHRIYGEKRLPLLLNGWKTKTVFEQTTNIGYPLGGMTHPLMVLSKG